MCVTVAQETINLAYTRRSSDPNLVGPTAAWWYNVLFVYSAATVLVAARLCPPVLSETSQEAISKSWYRAIELLGQYQGFNSIIAQLVATLHTLYNVLPEHYVQAKETGLPATRLGQPLNSGNSDLIPQLQSAGQRQHALGFDAFQTSDTDGMALASMVPEDGLAYQDFDFAVDVHDLSWLNAMPFEM